MSNQNIARHVPADTGPSYWGPGDRYTFLATGAQTNGAYFIMEGIVPPGGGPPPHIHHREEEGYYILEGTFDITLGDKQFKASAGDFVQIPLRTVHRFHNAGSTMARLLIFCAPAGLEKYFEEVFEPVQDRSASPPPVMSSAFENEFTGMARNPVTLAGLQQVRRKLKKELPTALTASQRKFLLGLPCFGQSTRRNAKH